MYSAVTEGRCSLAKECNLDLLVMSMCIYAIYVFIYMYIYTHSATHISVAILAQGYSAYLSSGSSVVSLLL